MKEEDAGQLKAGEYNWKGRDRLNGLGKPPQWLGEELQVVVIERAIARVGFALVQGFGGPEEDFGIKLHIGQKSHDEREGHPLLKVADADRDSGGRIL